MPGIPNIPIPMGVTEGEYRVGAEGQGDAPATDRGAAADVPDRAPAANPPDNQGQAQGPDRDSDADSLEVKDSVS